MEIISRADAKKRGLEHYYTGKPCSRGHMCERHTANWCCVECQKDQMHSRYERRKAEYHQASRTWARTNADRRAAICAATFAKQRGAEEHPDYKLDLCVPFYAEARRKTRLTGVPHEVDHIVPIARGGQHIHTNLQVIMQTANRIKGDRLVYA